MATMSGREVMEEIHHRVPDIEVRDEQIETLDNVVPTFSVPGPHAGCIAKVIIYALG